MGFSKDIEVQKTLVLIPDLKDVRQLAAGNNHVLALDGRGKVFAWGCAEKGQLGRNGRTGQGTEDDIKVPTMIDDKAIRGKTVAIASAGGSFSIVASVAA
jgi:regulator of chromosome condensation